MKETAWRLGEYTITPPETNGEPYHWDVWLDELTYDYGKAIIDEKTDTLQMWNDGWIPELTKAHTYRVARWNKTKYYIDPLKKPRRKRLVPK